MTFKQNGQGKGCLLLFQQKKYRYEQNNYQGALQKPIGSPFNATSTATDVIKGIDLTGKVVIVTCGYADIGLEI